MRRMGLCVPEVSERSAASEQVGNRAWQADWVQAGCPRAVWLLTPQESKVTPEGHTCPLQAPGSAGPHPPRQEHCILGEAWSSAPMLPTTSAEGWAASRQEELFPPVLGWCSLVLCLLPPHTRILPGVFSGFRTHSSQVTWCSGLKTAPWRLRIDLKDLKSSAIKELVLLCSTEHVPSISNHRAVLNPNTY